MAMREAFTVGIVLAAKDMYSGVTAKAQRNLGILRKTSKDTADAFEKSMKRCQGIMVAGAAIAAVSAQVSGKIQEMNKDAIDFSAAVGKMGTVVLDNLGKFKSHQAAMEAWRTKALNLSTRSLFNATELIDDASYELMSSGLKADEAMDMLESVSTAAIATVGNLNTTSALFGSIMNTFGKRWDMSSLEKGTRIMDVLAGAVKEFQWTGDVLAEGLSYATSAAQTMNVRLEDAVAILGMLNSKGIKGSKAGTALNATYRELTKSAKSFGISIEDVNGDLLPMPEILEKINNKLKGMGAVKKAATILKYFGEEGGKAIMLLMENSEALETYIEDLQESGIAAEMAKERMGTLSAEVKIQEHRWQNLRTELGRKALPSMIKAKGVVLDLAEGLIVSLGKGTVGATLGFIGIAAEAGKMISPLVMGFGAITMWKTQAALAATTQAALNKQMAIGSVMAGRYAVKMGAMNKVGLMTKMSLGKLLNTNVAMIGPLGKIGIIGATAFAGWQIGTLLRQVPGLDEAVQKLFATLSGKTLEVEGSINRANETLKRLKEGLEITEEEKKFTITFEYRHMRKAGYTKEEATEKLGRMGFGEEDIKKHARGKTLGKKMLAATPMGRLGGYQIGTKRVGKTGIAVVHEGEEITPKSMAGGDHKTIVHMGGVTINLKSTGSAPMDAYQIKRELDKLYKQEARRLS